MVAFAYSLNALALCRTSCLNPELDHCEDVRHFSVVNLHSLAHSCSSGKFFAPTGTSASNAIKPHYVVGCD
jgi:hypothetical protein